MTNLASYILFFLANFLIVALVPEDNAKIFLSNYSIFSLFVGPIVFIYFSKYFIKKIFFIKILIFFNIIFTYLVDNFSTFVFIYVLNIFFCDFLFSQVKNDRINFIYKFLSVIIILPLVFDFVQFETTLSLRIILSTFFLIILLFQKPIFAPLQIRQPLYYQLFTNLNYYLPLLLLTLIIEDNILKITYIIFQTSFSLILKLYDLQIRNIISSIYLSKLNYLNILIMLSPVIFLYLNVTYYIFFLYFYIQ